VVVASGAHAAAASYGVPGNSLWFVIAGIGFLAVTAAAHLPLSRSKDDAADPMSGVNGLLLSMAIRLAGTFLILGLLLLVSPLERPEAVFNVLFWYITLTATDLVILVRERGRMERLRTRRALGNNSIGSERTNVAAL
jgi:formate-dependent nitrite reductase membrane component NrfD